MNTYNDKYTRFALCNEMMETVEIIKNFDPEVSKHFVPVLYNQKKIIITGEGSSRIFPGKHFKDISLVYGTGYDVVVEGATQAMEYQLGEHLVFGVSNSGRTKELVSLFRNLNNKNHPYIFGLTATPESPITQLSLSYEILSCGKELAIAATKSVIEQTMFFESLFLNYTHKPMSELKILADDFKNTLEISIDPYIVETLCKSPIIYFSGKNNGVAEELALKANEITRKKSTFLQGTYALHGIEEVMQPGEVLVIIEPFEQVEQKFYDVIHKGAGVDIIAISSRNTIFPTIKIPANTSYGNYIELAAGWNFLVETGLTLGINIDEPTRARKIGNEV